ncbi:hypothetical protein Tco_1325765 [Tanacetum coccineum]
MVSVDATSDYPGVFALTSWASSVGHQDSLGAWGGDALLGEVSSSSPARDFYPFRRNKRKYRRFRIWDDNEVHNLRSVGIEFPAIVFDDTFTSQAALLCEPTVSPLNDNEIDFRISFDESDDEDYTVIFDKNSFSYKITYVENLKTDLENDKDKVNMPSFPSPEPTVSYFDDLDYLKDFENEFPTIVYNDALTSKSNFLTEPSINPQCIDEFNLKDQTSLSKCDGEEPNILYFNDLFPFNIIYPNELKSNEDNDNKKVDVEQPWGMFEGLDYTDADITDFEDRLGMIYSRGIHRVLVLDFESLSVVMVEGLTSRMLMEHRDIQGQSVFTSRAWRRLFEVWILQKSQENGESRANSNTGMERVNKSQKFLAKGQLSQPWSTLGQLIKCQNPQNT